MKTPCRNIASIFLIISITMSGLPVFHFADTNRDRQIDLADAILTIRHLAASADRHADFSTAVKTTLSILHIAAGLKAVIQAPDDKSSGIGGMLLDSPWLTGTVSGLDSTPIVFRLTGEAVLFTSHLISPAPPPPEMV